MVPGVPDVPKVPGVQALNFAARWFDPQTVHRTFEPLIADWQREWYDSPPSRRAWVSLRGCVAFLCAAVISTPAVVAAPIPHLLTRRVAGRVIVFCLIAADLLSIPMVRSIEAPWLPTLLLRAIPTGLLMAFPFAMIIAVDAIRKDAGVPPHIARAAALKLAVIAMLLTIAVNGLVLPFATQQWWKVTTPAGWNIPEPTLTQLSTPALLTHPDRYTAIVPGHYTRAGEIRRELIKRVVLSMMPALFIWLRWSAWSHPRRRQFWPLPALAMTALVIVAFFVTFFGGFRLEIEWEMQPGTGLMLPLIVFGLWSLAEQEWARRTWRGPSVPHEA